MQFLYPNQADPRDWIYDIETYPNIFTCAFIKADTLERVLFEISDRKNQIHEFINFCMQLKFKGCRMVGFNNLGFDYLVIHDILQSGGNMTVGQIYDKAMSVIHAQDNARFGMMIWDNDRLIEQIDLFKIHHYDNKNKSVSLKMLEINMGMDDVSDLPFPVGTVLNDAQKDELIVYNFHDVEATWRFYMESLNAIKSRERLTEQFGINMMNANDTKIGKDYFISRLEAEVPGVCYDYSSGRRKLRQTIRETISLRDVILPMVSFEHPEFQRIHNWLWSQTIRGTKGVLSDVSCTINGFTFDFGTGGIHGSIESSYVVSDDEYIILDLDVASYYPNLAIANDLYPEHLSTTFCRIYRDVYEQRKQYPKGTPENAMFKLALNGVYGDSNNEYSPFYDPAYTMAITINGQLLLCMLAEQLMKVPGLKMIQINTDGLTVHCPRVYRDHVGTVAKWWESVTRLELESNDYERMAIRDVNSYIAVYKSEDGAACPCGCGYMSGKVKRKGAYCYGSDLEFHQDHSMQIVAKAAEAALLHGEDVEEFIHHHAVLSDFLIATKVPRSTALVQRAVDGSHIELPNIVRYAVTTDGHPLFKIMPAQGPAGQYKRGIGVTKEQYDAWHQQQGNLYNPDIHTKNKKVYEESDTKAIQSGYNVTVCNDIQQLRYLKLNYAYYIKKARQLVDPILGEN